MHGCSYLRKSWDLASMSSTPSPSSGCRGRPAKRDTTASILAWSRSLYIAHHTHTHTDEWTMVRRELSHFLGMPQLSWAHVTERYLVRHLMSSSAAWLEVPITQSVRYSTILFLQTTGEDNSISQTFQTDQGGNKFVCKGQVEENTRPYTRFWICHYFLILGL